VYRGALVKIDERTIMPGYFRSFVPYAYRTGDASPTDVDRTPAQTILQRSRLKIGPIGASWASPASRRAGRGGEGKREREREKKNTAFIPRLGRPCVCLQNKPREINAPACRDFPPTTFPGKSRTQITKDLLAAVPARPPPTN
jgi:hypothetical protein